MGKAGYRNSVTFEFSIFHIFHGCGLAVTEGLDVTEVRYPAFPMFSRNFEFHRRDPIFEMD